MREPILHREAIVHAVRRLHLVVVRRRDEDRPDHGVREILVREGELDAGIPDARARAIIAIATDDVQRTPRLLARAPNVNGVRGTGELTADERTVITGHPGLSR